MAGATQSSAVVRAEYGRLPLSFERNRGQAVSGVSFLAHGTGYTALLSSTHAVIAAKRAAVTLRLLGANQSAASAGLSRLPGTVSYFVGNDQRQWLRGLHTYRAVRYRDVYPGIDMEYHGFQGRLEYSFLVAPGASPAKIQLGLGGAHAVRLAGNGDLVFASGGENVRQLPPRAFQRVSGHRVRVDSRYVRLGARAFGIRIGSYDARLPLLIDPTIVFSTLLGGTGNDQASAIAVDNTGSAYVTGSTNGGFPVTPGSFNGGTCCNISTAFVSKLNPSGTALVYSAYLGIVAGGSGIAVDSSGDAYVVGTASGINGNSSFPTTPGAFQTVEGGGAGNAFLTKLNPSGTALIYSTYLGGSGTCCYGDNATSVAVDSAGDAYVAGAASSSNFPTTPGAFQTSLGGPAGGFDRDAFVAKFNPSGSALVYSTLLGGNDNDSASGIAVDSAGNAYVSGTTSSTNFPVTVGAYQSSPGGASDGFVAKLDPTGSSLVYSTYLGGASSDTAAQIAVDNSGNAYVDGSTSSANFPVTPGAFQAVLAGSGDAFVTKLDPTGSALVYSTYLGGSGSDRGSDAASAIALDGAGHVYATGQTYSTDFPTTQDAYQPTLGPPGWQTTVNAFVSELDTTGSSLLYSTYLGGVGDAFGTGIAVGAHGVYATGLTEGGNGPDFPTTPGAFQTTFGGSRFDAYVVRFAPTDITPPTITCTPPDQATWYAMDVSVPCTASDAGTGLANPADASFSLTTTVPTGTETSAATTDSHQVCDNASNCGIAGPFTFMVDKLGPTLTCSAAPTFALNQAGATVSATVTDGGSGAAQPTVTAAADTTIAGAHVVSLTGVDNVGNQTTVACPYQVSYVFGGFLPPVSNPPRVNSGHAGRTYPLKWQLTDANGNAITSLGAVSGLFVKPTSCASFTNDPSGATAVQRTGSTSLRVDGSQYIDNWATPGPGCYTLFLELFGGQSFTAYFNLS